MSEPQQKYLTFLDSFSKSGGVLLVITYLAGFLIVSLHLSQYGVSTFSVLHLKYLVAGAWAMAPALLSVTLNKAALLFSQKANSFWHTFKIRHAIITNIIGTVPLGITVTIIAVYFGQTPNLK